MLIVFGKKKHATISDAIVTGITFLLIASVSWLFNREMEKALQRARHSEAVLKKERDQLEIMVAKRTRELKQAQTEKLMQLYRFAAFGKLSSGLFHELATPLSLISLNLNQLRVKSKQILSQDTIKTSLERAMVGTKRIEKFLEAARKQIQTQDVLQRFSLNKEILQAMQMLEYKVKKEKIKTVFYASENITVFGNPLKFTQLITNLISNAIDAYEDKDKKDKRIEIVMKKVKKSVVISVQDWGSGIDSKNLPKIFDPLFTTKSFDKGTGIGLSLCKDIVERDFKGKILVESAKEKGTTFTITFPILLSQRIRPQKTKNNI